MSLKNLGFRFQAPPMPARRYAGEISSAAMLAAKRSAGVAPEVNLKEHITCMPTPSAYKLLTLALMRHHQKSKTGESVAPQKGLMTS